MGKTHPHEAALNALKKDNAKLFAGSNQAIYVYCCDSHKLCNKRFSDMLGYKSPEQWAAVEQPFTEAFVEPKSRGALVSAYRAAMEEGVASSLKVTWKTKTGGSLKTNVILAPLKYGGELLALHYISKI